jgi:ABC-2 type transport system ATP-binding protein
MTAPPDAVIEAQALTKRYGGHLAVDHLDLTLPEGLVFGYLGPNGAGKTTTIRILVGLLRPSAGSTRIAGLDGWVERDRVHARIGYLPGDFVGYPELTGRDYLRYLGALRGLRADRPMLDLCERLDTDLSRRIGALSHGNRQKLGIVQALMHEPEVLVLDEPTTGLDPLAQREFLDIVRDRRNAGCTVFLSSHVLSEVEAVADRVGILRAGRLVADLDVSDVRSTATRRVDLVFDRAPDPESLRRARGVAEVVLGGDTAHVVASGSLAELFCVAAPYGVRNVVTHESDLEDLFLSYYDESSP